MILAAMPDAPTRRTILSLPAALALAAGAATAAESRSPMPTPFAIAVPDRVLADLKRRLAETRWPDAMPGRPDLGVDDGMLRRVCAHWQGPFDWRAVERRLNTLPQFRIEVDGIGLHLLHAKSGQAGATPLLLTNGWPGSFLEYESLIPLLTAQGFDVIAPALPGYGFSDRPTVPGMNASAIAPLFAGLMSQLGYDKFLVHASDMGAGVAEQMRRHMADRLLGVHFSNVYWGYPPPADPTAEEKAYLAQVQHWQQAEGAYAMMQGTKPGTLAVPLNDSAAGLAAWILEKFASWSDGAPEAIYGLDGLCANLTIYWATETIGSSIRLYAEAFSDTAAQQPPDRGDVPVGIIVAPKDILPAPRVWGERWLNIVHWTEAPRGGHFLAWEAPDLLAADLVAFAQVVAAKRR